MATVNFSVPDHVRQLFNAAFEGKNKSAVIAELMLRAVENQNEQSKRATAIERLQARRKARKPGTAKEIKAAREALR